MALLKDQLFRQVSGHVVVCSKGVGVNAIVCKLCEHWVHKKCSGLRGKLADVVDFICPRCMNGENENIHRQEHVTVGKDLLECVDKFC